MTERELLEKIFENQVQTNQRLVIMDNHLDTLNKRLDAIGNDVSDTKSAVNAIEKQTKDFSEFRTRAGTELKKMHQSMDFIKHKGIQNEEDLFTLKKNLSLIK